MKNVILLLMLALAWSLVSTGQEKGVQRVNFELGFGMNFGAAGDGWEKVEPGPTLFIEGRRDIRELPVNLGLQIDLSTFRRKQGSDELAPRSFKFIMVGDYAPRRACWFSPFVGMGVGIAAEEKDFESRTPARMAFCLMPRAGIRLLRHASLTLDYEITRVTLNHFDLKFGIYF